MKITSTISLWLFFLFFPSLIFIHILPAASQIADMKFHQLTGNDGLSQNYISCMLQDHRGFMWIGTKDGLNRYDGYSFTVYRNDPFNTASLESSYITSLYEDPYHHLWVGTRDGGLNLFDLKHDRFIRIIYPAEDSAVKGKFAITALAAGPEGHLWIGNNMGNIFEVSLSSKNTDSLLQKTKDVPIPVKKIFSTNTSGRINSFYADGKTLWIGADNGLWQLNMKGQNRHLIKPRFTTILIPLFDKNIPKQKKDKTNLNIPFAYKKLTPLYSDISNIIADSRGNLWMASDSVLYQYDKKRDCYYAYVSAINHDQTPIEEQSRLIRALAIRKLPKKQDQIWAGLFNGLAILDLNDSSFTFYDSGKLHEKGKTKGTVTSLYCDKSGMLWLGSNGFGISTYSPEITLFNLPDAPIVNRPPWTVKDLSIRSFCEIPGEKNILWMGASDGLYKIHRDSFQAERINPSFKNNFQLNGVIYALASDSAGNLFIGYQYGLMKYNPAKNTQEWWNPFIKTRNREVLKPRVSDIFRDHAGRLWIATDYSLARFLPQKDSFVHYWYRPLKQKELLVDTYPVIYEDDRHKIWLGTGVGLFCFDPASGKFTSHYSHNDNNPHSISSNWVTSIVPDPDQSKKYLWISTAGGGLNRFDLSTKTFTHLTEKDGLSNNNIYGLLHDSSGRLWMSTNQGLTCYNPADKSFINFDAGNNLQNNEFNFGAFYKSASGEMFFGGITGYNYFIPKKIKQSRYKAPILITGFHLLGEQKENPNFILGNIKDSGQINLSHKHNNFTITLSSLDFSDPDKNEYAYRIKNQNDQWIPLGTNRNITFTNMAPGKYVFQVKATNSTGYWNPDVMQFAITIAPPWWKTVLAYIVYALLAIALIVIFRKRELNRLHLKNKLQIEQLEAAKLKELDHMKSRFFANISHEFRTPLTLLIGPIEDMINGGDPKTFREIIPEMHRNSKRLLQLINQLLDLSRLDAGKYRINAVKESIIPFVKQIVHSFSSLANAKDITLETDVDPRLRDHLDDDIVAFYFDDDIMEKILVNLLSNAFKFTPSGEGEHIIVTLALAENAPGFLQLKVKDTGKGIPADKLPYVFNRFYQAGNAENQATGSGIGLALIKELVELHEGRIFVNTETGKGTEFICLLPFNKKITTVKEEDTAKKEILQLYVSQPAEEDISTNEKSDGIQPVILLVEDQQDVRKYLKGRLKDQYAIVEAQNGKQGLEMAFEAIPDMVISDVMMPGMDGFELCTALKNNDRTSHIPVILLTARAEDNDKMAGLETGADAYLIKPFNSKELLIRVKNLIALRNKMRTKFSNRLVVKPAEIAVTPLDREFMQKLLKTVEAHLDDENFTVADLGKAVNMSVSQINRKLKALINQSASQFIKSVRLQEALELLKKDSATIAEIAFRTGFDNPSYFSKIFKAQFGCLPSEKEKFPK